MKRFFFVLFTFTVLSPPADLLPQGYWSKISSPTDKLLRHVFFVDSTTGWAAGRDGLIIHTTDGGKSWTEQNSTVQTFIIYIFFLNESIGWALTIRDVSPSGTIILSTTNGGNQWTTTGYPEDNIFMNTIFFFDSLDGFLGGSKIVRTTDGGLNWLDVIVDSNMVSALPVYKFNFYNRQFGYACGGFIDLAGVIWRTTNYGLNWTATGVSPDQVFDLFVIDSLNAITLSGDPEGFFGIGNIKTTDAGESWRYDELPFFSLSFAIDFRTSSEGWSASGYQFMYTSDKGDTWIEEQTSDSAVIFDLAFTDYRTGYAVGDNGAILKYFTEPSDSPGEIPDNFLLFQNYPNPFNQGTEIKYSIPTIIRHPMSVEINIYDTMGNLISTLLNEEKTSGEHKVYFNPAVGKRLLASGIYFYQFKTDSFIQTKKMVYLK